MSEKPNGNKLCINMVSFAVAALIILISYIIKIITIIMYNNIIRN